MGETYSGRRGFSRHSHSVWLTSAIRSTIRESSNTVSEALSTLTACNIQHVQHVSQDSKQCTAKLKFQTCLQDELRVQLHSVRVDSLKHVARATDVHYYVVLGL